MAVYQAYMNKPKDKLLFEYGRILAKKGIITNPPTRYKITKFLLEQAVRAMEQKVIGELKGEKLSKTLGATEKGG